MSFDMSVLPHARERVDRRQGGVSDGGHTLDRPGRREAAGGHNVFVRSRLYRASQCFGSVVVKSLLNSIDFVFFFFLFPSTFGL